MKENTEEKRLRVIKDNIFNKLLDFFKRIISNKKMLNVEFTNSDTFLNNIVINKDNRLEKLKNLLNRGEIKAKDLSVEDIGRLQIVYDEEIENKKIEILMLTKKLKTYKIFPQ